MLLLGNFENFAVLIYNKEYNNYNIIYMLLYIFSPFTSTLIIPHNESNVKGKMIKGL